MAQFKPKPKERGNVILAQDWNSAMSEIVRLGDDLDKQTLKRIGGTVQGDLNVTGAVTAGGKLGVGMVDPKATVDIQQAARSGNHPTSVKGLYVTGDFGETGDGVEFRHSNGTQGIGFGCNTIYATGTNADQDLNLMPRGNGKVGIGTNAPGAKLEVNGDIKTQLAIINNGGYGNEYACFSHKDRGAQGNYALLQHQDGQTFLNAPTGKSINFRINHVDRMTLDDAGLTFSTEAKLIFAPQARQMINLWTTEYGIGIQGATQYFRTARNFAWYKGGSHNDGELDAGGGTVQMVIKDGNVGIATANPSAPLEVNGAVKATSFEGDGSKLTGLDAVSKSGGAITGALTIGDALTVKTTVTAASFVGDGSKLTGIAAADARWIDTVDGVQYRIGKKLTIGAANSGTSLQVINKNQDPSGDTVVIGKSDGTHLRLGYDSAYAWLQSQTDKPLAINPLGGKVGIGTSDPQAMLDVAGGPIVMRQATDAKAADALLDKLPNGSLIIGGPSGETIAFFWKDENGKKYRLGLKGEALTS